LSDEGPEGGDAGCEDGEVAFDAFAAGAEAVCWVGVGVVRIWLEDFQQ